MFNFPNQKGVARQLFLATNSSSTKNVKKLAGVAAGKETAIGARCKDKLLITHILKFKSVKGVGGKYLRTIRMRNNQVLKIRS